MRVQAAPKAHYGWLVQRTQCAVTDGFRAIEAVDGYGRVRGMVGYDSWTLNAVQAHMAVDTPVAWRALLRPAFFYPFVEAGRGLLLAIIPASNRKSIRLARRFGFRETYRVHDGWAVGEDLVVHEMRKFECPYLSPERSACHG